MGLNNNTDMGLGGKERGGGTYHYGGQIASWPMANPILVKSQFLWEQSPFCQKETTNCKGWYFIL